MLGIWVILVLFSIPSDPMSICRRGWRPLNIARVAWVILGFAALYLQILALDSASSVDQESLEGPQNCALQNQVDMALLAYDLRQGTPSVNHCVPWLENGE